MQQPPLQAQPLPQPQFGKDHRAWIALEYHKRKDDGYGFLQTLLTDFAATFPGVRVPNRNTARKIWEKFRHNGTVNNCNSKSSPGQTYSGRPRTARTPPNCAAVKAVMDRDAVKVLGAPGPVSPVSSARRNPLADITKSSWSRIKVEIK